MNRRLKAVLAAFGLAAASAVAAPAGSLSAVVSGSAHQAFFGVATRNDAAIAVGVGGTILASADRGKSWKPVLPAPTKLALFGIAIDQGHAIAVGQQGTVLRLDSNGQWTAGTSGTDARLFSVAVNGSGRAIAVGSFGTVILSNDGGASWQPVAPDWSAYTADGAQPHLYAAAIDEAGAITIAGEFGLILRSSDAGASWQLAHKGEASLFAIDLRDPQASFAVGQTGTLLRSSDGGKTWTEVATNTEASLLGVRSVGGGRVVATGIRELLLSDDLGLSWHSLSNADIATSWYQGVDSDGEGGAWIVGHSGRILKVGS